MINTVVHNITDKTNAPPMAITIGGVKIRPGKYKEVPSQSITPKIHKLHGISIWIGKLPKSLSKEKHTPQRVSSMDQEQAFLYLKSLSLAELQRLLAEVTPAVTVKEGAPLRRYVYSLRAACFSDDFVLNPESFFWLGRWKKLPNGDYEEV